MILACGAVLLSACAHDTQVALRQPQLPGLQSDISLRCEQAYWVEDAEAHRLVAEFPLPGAATGRPNYLLYLRMPAGSQTADGAVIAGFFIQTRGEYAGLAVLTEGRMRVVRGADLREYEVNLRFEDGTQMCGTIVACQDRRRLQVFETELRPGDVQAVIRRIKSG